MFHLPCLGPLKTLLGLQDGENFDKAMCVVKYLSSVDYLKSRVKS